MPRDKRAPGNYRIQGEGDYVSGLRFQKDQEQFVRTHDTAKLGRAAAPRNAAERRELLQAERKGKARAAVRRKPAKRKARAGARKKKR